jgi:uncharacterized protein
MKTELDHLPNRKQRDIAFIRDALLEEFDLCLSRKSGRRANWRILKIILFGSHAKGTWVEDHASGYISDYDIMVIVNDRELMESYEVWNAVEDRAMRKMTPPLGLILHTWEEVCQALSIGAYFFKDIREQGIELYSYSLKELPTPGNLSAEDQLEVATKYFSTWFDRSASFLDIMGYLMGKGKLHHAAFELHQATEHFFACVLLVHTNYLPKTHNILHFRSLCAQIDPAFADIFPNEGKRPRRATQRLKRAYVDARYSMHYEITEEELNWLSAEVEKLQALTKASCEAKLAELSAQLS